MEMGCHQKTQPRMRQQQRPIGMGVFTELTILDSFGTKSQQPSIRTESWYRLIAVTAFAVP